MARRLELDPPGLTGDPVTVAENVSGAAGNGYADFSLSRNGTLFHGQGAAVAWRDRAGKVLETIGEPVQGSGGFALSPDGVRAAYAAGPGFPQTDIWVMELGRAEHADQLQPRVGPALVTRRETSLLQQVRWNHP